jgi:hypothetical protein
MPGVAADDDFDFTDHVIQGRQQLYISRLSKKSLT